METRKTCIFSVSGRCRQKNGFRARKEERFKGWALLSVKAGGRQAQGCWCVPSAHAGKTSGFYTNQFSVEEAKKKEFSLIICEV